MYTIPQDILPVLSELVIDGCHVRIAGGQLDRATYTKVDKVLKALGGKWSRKDAAHVFPDDPTPGIDAAINLGKVATHQDLGWFPTPDPVADRVVELAGISSDHRVLEPSAGRGALLEAVARAGRTPRYTAIEIDRERCAYLAGMLAIGGVVVRADRRQTAIGENRRHTLIRGDFMTTPLDGCTYDRVIMNPPFCKVGEGDHLDHVRRASSLLRPGGVLVAVLPASIEFRMDKRHVAFREWYRDQDGYVEELELGAFKTSGTNVNAVLFRLGRP